MASPPDLLISRKKNPIQVYIQTSALTLQQDGNTVASVTDEPTPQGTSDYGYPVQRVVEAFGKRFIVVSGSIRERDQGGAGNWGTVHTFTGTISNGMHSGLHVISVGGEETVVCLYITTTNEARAVSSQDGITWTDTSVFNLGEAPKSVGHALGWVSSLYWLVFLSGSNHATIVYDFGSAVFTRIARPDGADFDIPSSHLAVHKGKLFNWGTSGSFFPAKHRLRRLDGVTYTNAYTSDHTFLHATLSGQLVVPSVLFTDPTTGDLILIGNESDPADTLNPPSKCGLFCMKVTNAHVANGLTDASSDVTDLTTTVFPSNLRSTLNGGTHPDLMQDMLGVYVDTTTTPGTPVVFFYRARTTSSATASWTQAGSWEWFEWKGVNTLVAAVGASVADGTNYVIPSTPYGGGSHLPSSGLARFAFDGGAPVEVSGGSIKHFFRVYGSGAAGSWKIYWGFDAPTALMSLVASTVTVESGAPSTTPTNTTSQIDNLTPDAGATLYSVQINASGAGIGSGQRYFLMAVPV